MGPLILALAVAFLAASATSQSQCMGVNRERYIIDSEITNVQLDEDMTDILIKNKHIIIKDDNGNHIIKDDKNCEINIEKTFYQIEADSDRVIQVVTGDGKNLRIADGFEITHDINGNKMITKHGYPSITVPKDCYRIKVDSNGILNLADEFMNPIIVLKPLPPHLIRIIGDPLKKKVNKYGKYPSNRNTGFENKVKAGKPLSDEEFEAARMLPDVEAPSDGEPDYKDQDLFEGDIIIETETELRQLLGGEFEAGLDRLGYAPLPPGKTTWREARRWPHGIVPYYLDTWYTSDERKKIAKAIDVFHNKTCVTFVAMTDEHYEYNHVFFHKSDDPNYCASSTGHQGRGVQYIHLGRYCIYGSIGTAIHEIMHALGFWHEHQRSDRDKFIDIHWNNIKKSMLVNFCKKPADQVMDLDLPYDYGSIMHYYQYAGRKANITGQDKSVITTHDKGKQYLIGQMNWASESDILGINNFYNCTLKICDPPCVWCYSTKRCVCDPPWNTGPTCDQFKEGYKVISECNTQCQQGSCNQSNACVCNAGWTGAQCDQKIVCYDRCKNGGTCLVPNKPCLCPPEYKGRTCQMAKCSPFCVNGDCISGSPNKCSCLDGYGGPTCNVKVYRSLHKVSIANNGGIAKASSSHRSGDHEPMNAFGDSGFWHSNYPYTVPQTIWVEFTNNLLIIVKYSFTSRTDNGNNVNTAGPSKYIFWASNYHDCSVESQWVMLREDNSGTPFAKTNGPKEMYILNLNPYRCYGFKVNDVPGRDGIKPVTIENIKLYTVKGPSSRSVWSKQLIRGTPAFYRSQKSIPVY